jgi:hypothetical protein
MYKILSILLVAVVFFTACEQKKEYTESELDFYANVLTQLYLIQGYDNAKLRESGDTLLLDKFDTDTIYTIYGTTEADFKRQYDELKKDPESFKATYAIINTRLDSLQMRLKRQSKLSYSLPLPKNLMLSSSEDSISSDSPKQE